VILRAESYAKAGAAAWSNCCAKTAPDESADPIGARPTLPHSRRHRSCQPDQDDVAQSATTSLSLSLSLCLSLPQPPVEARRRRRLRGGEGRGKGLGSG
jgi:hypothetical protein